MTLLEKRLIAINIIIYSLLTVFSYAFVDLNLTLSQNRAVLAFVNSMQFLGYYNRPLSTIIYVLFILIAFSFFIFNLYLLNKQKLSARFVFILAFANFLILVPSYPFLSSDIFNYMFDAKIIVNYHLSPYTSKALDFPNDEWVRFMRWVHRYSPYGPLWLGFSTIPYVLGFGKFITTLLSFKVFIGIFHLINAFLIYKISQSINKNKATFATAVYALNPLFLIEGIANAHNDVLLATMLILPIYFLVKNKNIFAYLSIFAGIFIKYIPLLILPWVVLTSFFKKETRISKIVYCNLVTMAVFTILFSNFRLTVPFVSSGATQVQFQPWYLFWTLPFISLISNFPLITGSVALSLGASLRYMPFIYYGDWSQPHTIEFMKIVTLLPALLIIFYLFLKKLSNRSK